jgi:hypothetical protein
VIQVLLGQQVATVIMESQALRVLEVLLALQDLQAAQLAHRAARVTQERLVLQVPRVLKAIQVPAWAIQALLDLLVKMR